MKWKFSNFELFGNMATLGILKRIAELYEQNKNRKPMPYTQIIKANPDKKQPCKKIKHYEEK